MIELLTISEVRRRTQNGFVTARLHAQVESAAARATREGKPYCEISLSDACDRMMLRVWDNHPDYKSCSALQDGDFIEIDGEFAQHQQFGLEAKTWKSRSLTPDEIANLLAGILFHDSGKLWENHLPEDGFTMGFDERGELMGHISIGLELVNSLWRKLQTEENGRAWENLVPASEDCRLHLLHLIASHHG